VLVLAGFDRGNAVVAIPIQLVGIALAVVCFRRGRKFVGLVGLFVPLVALVGALVPSRRQKPASSSA
jgi:thiamine transporter ThiT